jgi:hypothetical protein
MLCLTDSIRHDEPSVQGLLSAVEDALTRTELMLAAWQLARVVAMHLVEAVRAERARRPTAWPRCPACGASLRRKGVVQRQITSLCGPIRWRRRVGRCPHGCATEQVVPFAEALGVPPPQRPSGALQSLGGALAVFVPCATAATWLRWSHGDAVSPRAVWRWVPAAGRRAMEPLQEPWEKVTQGSLPTPEPLAAARAAAPVVLGADGVRVPFRPEGGHPTGKTRWREITVGVLARVGQHRTRLGQVVTRRPQRRLVAVLGDREALTPRLWLAAVRQGLLHAPQVVWLREGGRGVWRLFEERCSCHATGMVDLYHAAQHLWKGAAAWVDGRTTQARRWFAWARHRLRPGMPDGVLADLADALDVEGLPETARHTLTTV